jgi:glycosyltransferase involved in cell wall biosynthesis
MSIGQKVVSVIIPTHNRAKLLCNTIESVLAQSYHPVEIIVVDDGSTDDTAEMIERYGDRVRYIKQPNQGVGVARKTGFYASSGDYISFLDDDDLLLPNKIERQVSILETRPEVDIVHCAYFAIDQDDQRLEKCDNLPEGDVRKELLQDCFLWSGGLLIRRSCLTQIGTEETLYWEDDWVLWLRLALAKHRFAFIREPLGCYRVAVGSLLEKKLAEIERYVFRVLDHVFEHWELPAEIVAKKSQIQGRWHLWVSCRYYQDGYPEEGERSLDKALSLLPLLASNPQQLLDHFRAEALSPRVRMHDSIRFINDVFNHLPDSVQQMAGYRRQVLGAALIGLAIRYLGENKISEGQMHLQLAQQALLEPEKLTRVFTFSLGDFAVRAPNESPYEFIDTIHQNLPAEALALKKAVPRALGIVAAAQAFQQYENGNRQSVPSTVLSAWRHNPALLNNKGLHSILIRSLLSPFEAKR